MKDLGEGPSSIDEYKRYCHFVAGLVGQNLTQLFTASGLERLTLANHLEWANSMGLFLQKTNIIRDYPEDYTAGRDLVAAGNMAHLLDFGRAGRV